MGKAAFLIQRLLRLRLVSFLKAAQRQMTILVRAARGQEGGLALAQDRHYSILAEFKALGFLIWNVDLHP